VYVDAADVMCFMPEGAQNEDVVTDNRSDECSGVDGVMVSTAAVFVVSVVAAVGLC